MITHIKRSFPDLRAGKHQPLENKESPCGSPKHSNADNNGSGGAGTSGIKCTAFRNQTTDNMGCCEKETDAVTLSAIQTTSCTCGPTAKAIPIDNITAQTQIDKTRCCDLDEDDAALSSDNHHHHYHYHPYQHLHRQQSLHEMRYANFHFNYENCWKKKLKGNMKLMCLFFVVIFLF